MLRWMQLTLNELDFQGAFITDRRSYPHMICHWPQILKSRKYVTRFRKYLITSHVSQADQGYECVMSREELGGLVMYIFSLESRCRVASDRKELIWKKGLRTLNIISFSLSCVNSETHNLQRVFLRIFDTKGKSLCQAFPAETVEIGNKNCCVIKAMHVLRRKLRKD